MKDLKQNVLLLGRLYINCIARGGDIDDFIRHENLPFPPSLSEGGELRSSGNKSQIISCVYPEYEPVPNSATPTVSSLLINGPAFIHHCPPGKSKNFEEYAENCFLPEIVNILKSVERLDVVCDRYFTNSLKSATREKRGCGIKIRVLSDSLMPTNFKAFLRVDVNKTALFTFLAD